MNDDKDPIERELEKALAVEPSPDLQVRIRRRVGEIPIRPKRPLWLAPAFGLAAAAVMVLAVISLRTEETPPLAIERERPVAVPAGTSPITEIPWIKVSSMKTVAAHVSRQPEAFVALQQAAAMPGVIVTAPANTFIPSVEPLELAPLQKLELRTNPLPAMSLSPMARLDTFSIEPFHLMAHKPGVNE